METVFSNGNPIDSYMATGIAEGFEEATDNKDTIKAWSYLIGTGLAYTLQGWFGRTASNLIQRGLISKEGVVDWDLYEHELNSIDEPFDDDWL